MCYPTRHLLFLSRPCALSLGSSRWVLWRLLFSLGLLAACILALPRTSYAQAFTSLYSFGQTAADGLFPHAGLLQASDGNLYGTTYGGDVGNVASSGTVFRITTGGTLTTLHSFSGADGYFPYAALIQGSDGNLYGTTNYGGANGNYGTVFKFTIGGTLTTLHSFSGTDGRIPQGSLTQASSGILYGTTQGGGTNDTGTVFRITTGGKFTTLYSFSALNSNNTNSDGAYPWSGLIQAKDGNLYGTASLGGTNGWGTVFRITTGGKFTTLYSFSTLSSSNTNSDGAASLAGLIRPKDGKLYGTTNVGSVGYGTVFRITTGGKLTTLYSFSGGTDGANPMAGLIQAKDGNLYGTTQQGGEYASPNTYGGTVFRITTGGALTTLYSFSALSGGFTGTNSDGALPDAGLIQASDGNLYGTTICGGAYVDAFGNSCGTVYCLNLDPPTPILTRVSPSTANAAGPAVTLTLKGSLFAENATAYWTQGTTTTALTTTYISSTTLTATVLASLIAAPGTATLNVGYASGPVSNGEPFTILLTTLQLSSASLTKTGTGNYTANVTLKNVGHLTAPNVTITQATLGTAATSTTLPVSLGSIAKNKTGSTSLSFPSTAGSSGTVVTLNVMGTFTGGSFTKSLKVKLP